MGLVKMAHGATPEGGELGRWGQWKLKRSRANWQSRNAGTP